VPEAGLEPALRKEGDFKSPASTIPPLGHNVLHFKSGGAAECRPQKIKVNPDVFPLNYSPVKTKNGACDWIRTSDHPLRRRMLYPTELRRHGVASFTVVYSIYIRTE
jgi:hypothetical protein